ncbi:hypothetical protein MSG28_010318 [Choristoneura fumiferana]|uniref:Uncharacterized protein n=1 Tax=Choristoneura fumiferana TaxID=7141 RepID=A0ACC0KL29_CHOFU|nr:hypothetical protein MSG28_010318 [Choristoneura fumiferana]
MSDSEDDEVQNRTVKITLVGEPATGKSSGNFQPPSSLVVAAAVVVVLVLVEEDRILFGRYFFRDAGRLGTYPYRINIHPPPILKL